MGIDILFTGSFFSLTTSCVTELATPEPARETIVYFALRLVFFAKT
jgi:hypothetical protein